MKLLSIAEELNLRIHDFSSDELKVEIREEIRDIAGVSHNYIPGNFNPAEHQRQLRIRDC